MYDQLASPFSQNPSNPLLSSNSPLPTMSIDTMNLDSFHIYPNLQTLPIRPSLLQPCHLKRFSDGQIKTPDIPTLSHSQLNDSIHRKASIESIMDSGFYSPMHDSGDKIQVHHRSISQFDLFPSHSRQNSCDSFYSLTSSIPDTCISDIVQNEPLSFLEFQPSLHYSPLHNYTDSVNQSMSKTCIEEDEHSIVFCKWNGCLQSFDCLNSLVSHVSLDHIGV